MRRYCYTIRDVNEARRPHTCIRPCAFEKKRKEKKNKKSAPSGTHHENHSSQATATNSRWRATKQGPRVSPYSPASIDPGFVEIGLVHLSQSVKTTNVTHTHTQTNEIMAPRTHPGTSREVNEERGPHTCRRPGAFEQKKNETKNTKFRRTRNTARNPQQPGDRDHLETVRDETRPTR